LSILSSSTAPFSCLARSLAYLKTISFGFFSVCILFYFCWMSASSVFLLSALSVCNLFCCMLLINSSPFYLAALLFLPALSACLFMLCLFQFCLSSRSVCIALSDCISILLHALHRFFALLPCCTAASACPVCMFISCSVLSSASVCPVCLHISSVACPT
jgi:hypothetical protein